MFRSVLVIIFVIIIIWLARVVLQRMQQKPEKREIDSKQTLQCLYCKTYIPAEDAIKDGDRVFCSQQHLTDWKTSA